LIPVYVNCRDRVTHLRQLVEWLERAGQERIVLLDNASTFPPLLDYLNATPHQVVRLCRNAGSRALWVSELVPAERFAYTDPDVIPTDDCPLDAIQRLSDLLDRYSEFPKAALGLHLDDVPPDLPCLGWERSLVSPDRELEPGVYQSLADTTFAVYQPGAEFSLAAIRTGTPYTARHMPWYTHGQELSVEDRYYLEHATPGPLGSSWAQGGF
jgi:hypothetical protein